VSPGSTVLGGIPSALSGDAFERVATDVGDLWVSTQDQVMRHYLRTRAAWEEHEANLLRQLIRPGCRFLDIGANIGYFSLLAARCGAGSVDAVEPHPGLLQLLRFNLWMNRTPACIWPVALDTERRGLPLSSSRNNLGDTRVEHVQKEASYDLVVPALPGDELFHGRSFDVMKIDVQGNVWDSGPGGIWIISPQGKHLGTILTPERLSNLAWGDDDGKTMYTTGGTMVTRIRVKVAGIRP